MKVELVKTFHFEAAHSIPTLPEGHKCRRLHGHNYRVDVHVEGEVNGITGVLIDFGELRDIVMPVIDSMDHENLDNIDGMDIPTSETISRYIWDHLRDKLPILSAVSVWETPGSKCTYRGC